METINEFIEALNSKAKLEKERAFYDAVKWNCITEYGAYCRKLESEYRQLAEYLKELKAHREAWSRMKNIIKDLQAKENYKTDTFDAYKFVLDMIDNFRPKEDDAE